MHAGFGFEVYDLYEEKRIIFDCPSDLYDMLMYIGAPARYVIHSIRSKTLDITAAATSTQRLSLIAGKYVGKDDPVMIVRCQSGLPPSARRWSRSPSRTRSADACAARTTRRSCRCH